VVRAALGLLALSGCGEAAVDWAYRADGLAEPFSIEATVRAGDCEGAVVHTQSFRTASDAMSPPELDEGTYGFEIRFRDASCQVYARGCAIAAVPDDPAIVVEVTAQSPASACTGTEVCVAGECDEPAVPMCDCEDRDDMCIDDKCVPLVKAVSVSMARGFGCAIGEERDSMQRVVHCWGSSSIGQLGDGTCGGDASGTNTPVRVTALRGLGRWSKIETGGSNACVLSEEGEVFCWGSNTNMQTGMEMSPICSNNVPEPHEVNGPDGASWRDVASGFETTCAITDAGRRCCWGMNFPGGHDRFGDPSLTVEDVSAPLCITEAVDGWTSLTGANGGFCGLAGAEAFCVGWNDGGQLAAGATSPAASRGSGFETFSLGRGFGCAVRASDELTCFGCAGAGAFKKESGYRGCVFGSLGQGLDQIIQDGSFPASYGRRVLGIDSARAVGVFDRACAVDSTGALFCWGPDEGGLLGAGSLDPLPAECRTEMGTTFCAVPQPVDTPHHDFVAVDVGETQACAIREGGRLYCWGQRFGGTIERTPVRWVLP
jgi:hypothetical protein